MDEIERLQKETLEADKELLKQYRKELKDLEEGKGLSNQMSAKEISIAKRRLRNSINSFKGYLF